MRLLEATECGGRVEVDFLVGQIGLQVDNVSGGDFANLLVTPAS